MLFHKIEGACVVLLSKGVYRQVDAYQRNDELFARWGSGFIGVRYSSFGYGNNNLGTTLPHVTVVHVEGTEPFPSKGVGPVKLNALKVARAA